MEQVWKDSPQFMTNSRLLKLGESIDFKFYLLLTYVDKKAKLLKFFPCFLEKAHPKESFSPTGDLRWLNTLQSESLDLTFKDYTAEIIYRPEKPGNYIARWQVGGEESYRYFAVIEDDWIVISFSRFFKLDPQPTLHSTGIPLNYHLNIEEFQSDNPNFKRYLNYHRYYGDLITPYFPCDSVENNFEETVNTLAAGLERVKKLLPDDNDARSIWYGGFEHSDPKSTRICIQLGVNNFQGLLLSHSEQWIGMPEFPFFSSSIDVRKMHQGHGSVVSHQYDFAGSYHWLGPDSWHYGASKGNWELAREKIEIGLVEFRNLTEMSGHPAFVMPLYDGCTFSEYDYPPWRTENVVLSIHEFNECYLRAMAFEFPKKFKLAYARSLDVADYYIRNFQATPRTVFVSKTDDMFYDMWWRNHFFVTGILSACERIPWETPMDKVYRFRRKDRTNLYTDFLSSEYIIVEEPKRYLRFERECPIPIWCFDYTGEKAWSNEKWPDEYVEVPAAKITKTPWVRNRDDNSIEIKLTMHTSATFKDFAIALWGLPVEFAQNPSKYIIETNAGDYILAKNKDNEFHLILYFDLKPDLSIFVNLVKRE